MSVPALTKESYSAARDFLTAQQGELLHRGWHVALSRFVDSDRPDRRDSTFFPFWVIATLAAHKGQRIWQPLQLPTERGSGAHSHLDHENEQRWTRICRQACDIASGADIRRCPKPTHTVQHVGGFDRR